MKVLFFFSRIKSFMGSFLKCLLTKFDLPEDSNAISFKVACSITELLGI